MTTLSFFVSGIPVAWSRTRVATSAFGKMRFVNAASLTEYEQEVAVAASRAARKAKWKMPARDVPVSLTVLFRLPIAESTGKRKRASILGTPAVPSRGDLSNYVKAVEDGIVLSGWVIHDDAQITAITAEKRWCDAKDAGVAVTVTC